MTLVAAFMLGALVVSVVVVLVITSASKAGIAQSYAPPPRSAVKDDEQDESGPELWCPLKDDLCERDKCAWWHKQSRQCVALEIALRLRMLDHTNRYMGPL